MGKLKAFFVRTKNKLLAVIDAHPFTLFIGLLFVLLVCIIVGNYLRTPVTSLEPEQAAPTAVTIYAQGQSPTIGVTAKIEKSGVITIFAQTSGIVQKVPVTEGASIKRGAKLVILSTNYQGANAAAVTRRIAERTAQSANENYQLQKDTIRQQREVAEKTEAREGDLRSITRDSLQETRDLIKLNEEILNSVNLQLKDLEATNVNGATDSAILAVKQGKAQLVAGLNNLKSGLRSAEYSSSNEQEPTQLTQLQREITLKQLTLQEKSLDLSKDLANLQVKLQWISESLFYPATPCSGVVERVFVKVGQLVNPGTPLAVIRADAREITAVVSVPSEVAARVSRAELSTFSVDGTTVSLAPRYISAEPTDGTLHTILYSIPGEYERYFSNNEQVAVQVPLGAPVASTVDRYIPLDAVYQTQEAAFVYLAVVADGKTVARVRQVELGSVSGGYVAVNSGLADDEKVIITRGMTDGEIVSIQ